MAGQCARKGNGDEEGFTPTCSACLPGTWIATGCLDVWAIGDDAWKARAPAIEDIGRWRRRMHGGVTDYSLLNAHMRIRWEIPRCRVEVIVLYRIFQEDGPRRLACGVLVIPGDSEVSKCDGMGRKRKHVRSVHVSRAIKVAASAMRGAVALFGAICRASLNNRGDIVHY